MSATNVSDISFRSSARGYDSVADSHEIEFGYKKQVYWLFDFIASYMYIDKLDFATVNNKIIAVHDPLYRVVPWVSTGRNSHLGE